MSDAREPHDRSIGAEPAGPALVPARTFEGLAAVIGGLYPRWHVWSDGTGWHAMRRGNYRQLPGPAAGVHSLHQQDPVLLLLQLGQQDQIPPPDGWDIHEPARRRP